MGGGKDFLLSLRFPGLSYYSKMCDEKGGLTRDNISTKVIVGGAKDLDLLQGLLIYLAWYHFHFKLKAGQINMLVQIAVAMTIELDLGKPI